MLQQIQKSNRFQEDLKKYNKALSEMPEGDFKKEFTKLLTQLVNETKKLDEMHSEMVYTHQLPSMGTEIRDKITSIRKQIENKYKDWLDTVKSKQTT